MNKFIAKAHRNEEGASMLLALLLVLVLMALVASISALSIVGTRQSASTRDWTYYSQAADSAVQQALFYGNNPEVSTGRYLTNPAFACASAANPSPAPSTVSTFTNAASDKVKYGWCTIVLDGTASKPVLQVHGWGYRNTIDDNRARHVVTTMRAVVVAGIDISAQAVVYYPTPSTSFNHGFVGVNGVELVGATRTNTYRANTTSVPALPASDNGAVFSSNGTFSYTPETTFSRFDAYGVKSLRTNAELFSRCGGARCGERYTDQYPYEMSLLTSEKEVLARCGTTALPDWRASLNSASYNPGRPSGAPFNFACYNNVYFDTNTTLPSTFTDANPAYMFVTGNVIVSPGVSVNATSTAASPRRLRIYSSGPKEFILNTGSTSTPTRMAAFVAGQQLDCKDSELSTDSANTGSTLFYGGMSCSRLRFGASTRLWHDVGADTFATGSEVARKVWDITAYSETS